jgi:Tol biopolymer transport system component
MQQIETSLKPISSGYDFAVLNYFHVFPDSVDGEQVAYSRFPNGPGKENSGPCDVMVCDRDGGNQRQVGSSQSARHHRGACPTWIEKKRLAYEDEGTVHIVDVTNGERVSFPGGVDNYSPALGKIFFCDNREGSKTVCSVDVSSGKLDTLVRMEQMARFAPLGGVPFSQQVWRFAHAYVTPDGSKIAFAVFNRAPQEAFVFLADPDGANVRPFGPKPMHWTFYDNDSFFGHDDKRDIKDTFMRRWDLEGNILEVLSGPGCHGTISPDRQWIVTESWYRSDPVEIYLYRRGEVQPRRILAEMAPTWRLQAHVHPAFSRDGKRVFFNYNAPGGRGSQVVCYDLTDTIQSESSIQGSRMHLKT